MTGFVEGKAEEESDILEDAKGDSRGWAFIFKNRALWWLFNIGQNNNVKQEAYLKMSNKLVETAINTEFTDKKNRIEFSS